MRLRLLKDPSFVSSFWCTQYERGIRLESTQNSIELIEGLPEPGEGDSIVCLIGSSPSWIYTKKSELMSRRAKGILLTSSDPENPSGFSYVSVDYPSMMRVLRSYFRENGRIRTALFGSNPSSSTDALKVAIYRQIVDRPRVFENLGRLEETCAAFTAECGDFDSVICCSDLVAAELSRYLRVAGICSPEKLWIAGFGDTTLAAKVHPTITTIACDYVAIGRQSVKVAMMLSRNHACSTISMTVQGSLIPRESTGNVLPSDRAPPALEEEAADGAEVNIYADTAVTNLLAVENLLSHCEAVDFKILKGLSQSLRYTDLADLCFLSENTVKYRVKRMQNLAGQRCRPDLLHLAGRYLDLSTLD